MVAKRARDRASRGRIALRPDQESTRNHAYFLVAQLLVEVLGGVSTTGLPASTAEPEKNPRARAPSTAPTLQEDVRSPSDVRTDLPRGPLAIDQMPRPMLAAPPMSQVMRDRPAAAVAR